MSKHKAAGKDKEKAGQFVIRIDKSDRAAFIALCEKLDTSAAREIRRFMREFIAANTAPAQAEVPPESPAKAAEVPAPAPETPANTPTAEPAATDAPTTDVADDAEKPRKARKRVKS